MVLKRSKNKILGIILAVLPSFLVISGFLYAGINSIYYDLDTEKTMVASLGGFNVSEGDITLSGNTISLTPSGSATITAGAASVWQTTLGDLTLQTKGDLISTSSENLLFVSSGTERMRIASSTGYIGIATTTPYYDLDVLGNLRATTFYGSGANLTGLPTGNDGTWIFSGNTLCATTAASYVGIGTTSPGTMLDIYGTTTAQNIIPSTSLSFDLGSSGRQWSHLYASSSNFTLLNVSGTSTLATTTLTQLQASGEAIFSSNAYVDGSLAVGTTSFSGAALNAVGDAYFSGNVGIGTTGPNATLDIDGGLELYCSGGESYIEQGADSGSLLMLGGSNVAGGAYMRMYGGDYGGAGQGGGMTLYASTESGSNDYISFYAGGSHRMRILDTGNVGIGTTGPDRKLDVLDDTNPQLRLTHTDGSVYVDLQATSTGNLYINPSGGNVGIGTDSPDAELHITGSNSHTILKIDGTAGSDAQLQFADGGVVEWALLSDTSDDDKFKIYDMAYGARLVVDNTGNVGIATTSPDRKLEVFDSSNPQLRLTYTSTDVYTDFQTNSSGNLIINPSGGLVSMPQASTTLLTVYGTSTLATTTITMLEVNKMDLGALYLTNLTVSGTSSLATTSATMLESETLDTNDIVSVRINNSGDATTSNLFVTGSSHLGTVTEGTIGAGLTWSASQDINNQTFTNVDIDSGAIDGAAIGANSASTGVFSNATSTNLDVSTLLHSLGGLSVEGNTTLTTLTVTATSTLATTTVTMLEANKLDINDLYLTNLTVSGTSTLATTTLTQLQASGEAIFSSNAFFDAKVGVGTTTPVGIFEVATTSAASSSFLYVGNDGKIGIGTDSPIAPLTLNSKTNYGQDISVSYNSGISYGLDISTNLNSTANYVTYGINVDADADDSAGGSADATAGYFYAYADDIARGISAQAQSDGGDVYGGYFYAYDTGGNDDAYGVYIDADGGTNTYGLYVFDDKSYFGGNVGIATTSPDRKLEVFDSSNPQLRLTYTSTDVYTDFQADSSGNLIIDPSGGLVSMPQASTTLLTVYGTSTLATTTITMLEVNKMDLNDLYLTNLTVSGTSSLATTTVTQLQSSGEAIFSSNAYISGNLGIGTTSFSGAALNAVGDAYFSGNVGIGTTAPQRKFVIADTSPIIGLKDTDDNEGWAIYDASAGYLAIVEYNTTDWSSFTTPLVIKEGGNVGINTTGPDRKLDILDDTNPQLRLTHTDGSVYVDQRATSTGDLVITSSLGQLLRTDDTDKNVMLGKDAGISLIQGEGQNNIFIGDNAGASATTSDDNVFIGRNAGYLTVARGANGSANVAIGSWALDANTTGYWNFALGAFALTTNTIGSSNVAIGKQTMSENTEGAQNVAIGTYALQMNTSGNFNTAIGYEALRSSAQRTSANTVIGYAAGRYASSSSNVFLGYQAGRGNDAYTGGSNVFIGYQSGYYETGSNKLYIENSDAASSTALIYGEFDSNWVEINDQLRVAQASTTYSSTTDLYVSDTSHLAGQLTVQATSTLATTTITMLEVNKMDLNDLYLTNLTVSGTSTLATTTLTQLQSTGEAIFSSNAYVSGSLAVSTTSFSGGAINAVGEAYFSGDVGVGTTNPAEGLEVYDKHLRISNQGATAATLYLWGDREDSGDSGDVDAQIIFATDNLTNQGFRLNVENYPGASGFNIYDISGSKSRIYISSAGNVGIGTTSPIGVFEVATSSSASSSFFYVGQDGNIGLRADDPAERLVIGGSSTGGAVSINPSFDTSAHKTYTYDASAWTQDDENICASSDGLFYVGYSSPFSGVYFDVSTAATYSAGLKTGFYWEYYDGDSWEQIHMFDGTEGFVQDGALTFTPPSDWTSTTLSPDSAARYWIRIPGYYEGYANMSSAPVLNTLPTAAKIIKGNAFEIYATNFESSPIFEISRTGSMSIGEMPADKNKQARLYIETNSGAAIEGASADQHYGIYHDISWQSRYADMTGIYNKFNPIGSNEEMYGIGTHNFLNSTSSHGTFDFTNIFNELRGADGSITGVYNSIIAENDSDALDIKAIRNSLTTYDNDVAYGIYATDGGNGGTQYGVYLDLNDSGGTRYGIYETGGATNYFAGKVGIGTTTPTSTLHIVSATGGEIFRVDDEVGDATPFVIDNDGNVGIGTAAPAEVLHLENETDCDIRLASANENNPPNLIFINSAGTIGSPTVLSEGEEIGSVTALTTDGVGGATDLVGAFRVYVDGTVSEGSIPTRLSFDTSSAGGKEADTKMVIKNDGKVGIGTTSPEARTEIYVTAGGDMTALLIDQDDQDNSALTIQSVATTSAIVDIDISPVSSSTAILFDIDADGDFVGDFFDIDHGSDDIYSLSTVQGKYDVPVSFNSPGDVSLSYDLIFTNTSASYLKFSGPGYVQTDSASGNYDLTLSAAGTGNVIVKDTFEVANTTTTILYVNHGSQQVGIGTTSPASGYALHVDGNIKATGWTSDGADIAEVYFSDDNLSSGEIVGIQAGGGFVKKATSGSNMIGIVSTKPGVLLGGDFEEGRYPIALAGKVPVKLSLENGEVKPGDALTLSSSTPAVAVKATKAGRIIGFALEEYSSTTSTTTAGIMLSQSTTTPTTTEPAVMVFLNFSWLGNDLTVYSDGETISSTTSESGLTLEITESGIVKTGTLQTEKLEVGSPEKPTGITVYDAETGRPFCIIIKSGEFMHLPGECEEPGTHLMVQQDSSTQEEPSQEEPQQATSTTETITEQTTTTEDSLTQQATSTTEAVITESTSTPETSTTTETVSTTTTDTITEQTTTTEDNLTQQATTTQEALIESTSTEALLEEEITGS